MAEGNKPWPLAFQVFVPIGLIVGLFFVGAVVYDLSSFGHRVEVHRERNLRSWAPLVTALIEESMTRDHRAQIDRFLKAMRSGDQGVEAELLDAQGRLVMTSDFKGPRPPAPPTRPGAVVVEVPLDAKPACARCHGVSSGRLGAVRLTALPAEHERMSAEHVRGLLTAALLGALGIGLASFLAVSCLVHSPLSRLTSGMARIARGRFGAPGEGGAPDRDQGAAQGSAVCPLALQVFVPVALAVGLVFAGSFVYDLLSSSRGLEVHQERNLRALSPLVTSLIEESMTHEDRGQIDRFLKALNGGGHRVEAELLDAQGRLVRTSDFKGPRQPAPSPLAGAVVIEVPVDAKPVCARCHGVSAGRLGTVRLTALPGEHESMRAELVRSRLAMALVASFCIALASLFVVRRFIHAPMAALTAAMAHVAAGRFDARIEGEFPGELQFIADGFNGMVGEIARDRREILELHRRQVAHMDRLATLGELAAHLAHEVRNPLTGLSSALQVMEREAQAGSPRRELIGKMLSQLGRMDRTMGDFLRYARMPEAARRAFPLKEALSRVTFLIAPRLKAQRIQLAESVPADLPAVHGDPAQIEQVFLNLLLNAAQAMPEGGDLNVGVERNGGRELLVKVADTGAGIPPENLERIFEPFFTTREGGSGLGLPIARQTVMAHGGELWLESEPGKGTTVFVRLPTAPPEAA